MLAEGDEVGVTCTLDGWAYRCTCGEAIGDHDIHDPLGLVPPEVWAEHRTHVAAAVRVWLTEALAAPEVVEAARRTFYAQHIHPADGEAMRAALVAAADALRAGVTR